LQISLGKSWFYNQFKLDNIIEVSVNFICYVLTCNLRKSNKDVVIRINVYLMKTEVLCAAESPPKQMADAQRFRRAGFNSL